MSSCVFIVGNLRHLNLQLSLLLEPCLDRCLEILFFQPKQLIRASLSRQALLSTIGVVPRRDERIECAEVSLGQLVLARFLELLGADLVDGVVRARQLLDGLDDLVEGDVE